MKDEGWCPSVYGPLSSKNIHVFSTNSMLHSEKAFRNSIKDETMAGGGLCIVELNQRVQ